MVTATELSRVEIVDRIDRYRAIGKQPKPAAEQVLTDLCQEGFQQALWELIGAGPLFEIWSASHRRQRSRLFRDTLSEEPAEKEGEEEVEPTGPGPRVHDPALLRTSEAFLTAPVEIDGVWLTMGELTAATCRRVEAAYAKLEGTAKKRRRYFGRLAAVLEDQPDATTTTVADHFDEDALRRLAEEIEREP